MFYFSIFFLFVNMSRPDKQVAMTPSASKPGRSAAVTPVVSKDAPEVKSPESIESMSPHPKSRQKPGHDDILASFRASTGSTAVEPLMTGPVDTVVTSNEKNVHWVLQQLENTRQDLLVDEAHELRKIIHFLIALLCAVCGTILTLYGLGATVIFAVRSLLCWFV